MTILTVSSRHTDEPLRFTLAPPERELGERSLLAIRTADNDIVVHVYLTEQEKFALFQTLDPEAAAVGVVSEWAPSAQGLHAGAGCAEGENGGDGAEEAGLS